jgi:hypothetical protein
MTPAGWIIMLLAISSITALLGWCIYRVIVTPGSAEHLHTQADIEPPDARDDNAPASRAPGR